MQKQKPRLTFFSLRGRYNTKHNNEKMNRQINLIRFFAIQKSIYGAYFGFVVLVRFYGVIAVEAFYISYGILQFQVAAKVSGNRLKLIVRIRSVHVEG